MSKILSVLISRSWSNILAQNLISYFVYLQRYILIRLHRILLACSNLRKKSSENNKRFIKRFWFFCFFAASWAGALCLGAVDLPWQDQLCCDSPSARLAAEGEDAHVPERNRSVSDLPHPHPRCSYRKSTTKSHPEEFSGGKSLFTCVSWQRGDWFRACCVRS